jgi:hypothetical protein
MGSRLALFLGRLFVEELCHGFQWRVTLDGPLERGSRHRHHWRPSASKRIVMEASGEREPREAPRGFGDRRQRTTLQSDGRIA